MKTVQLPWPQLSVPYPREAAGLPWRQYVTYASVALATLFPVTLFTIASVWAINAGAVAELAATAWSAAFVMLAAAVDGHGWRAAVLSASGIALATLAWLSHVQAPEFGVLAAALAGSLLSLLVAETIIRAMRRSS